jgi:hypothetical protein
MISPGENEPVWWNSHGGSESRKRRKRLLAGLLVACVLGALMGMPSTAGAQQPVPIINMGFEPFAVAGEEIAVSAYLNDPVGNPIYDVEIRFTYEAEFMNVSGSVEIGTAVTDENGLALVLFEPRTEGENNLTAAFGGNDVFVPVSTKDTLSVLPGEQIYRELPPYRIPGANVWLTTGLIATVWLIFVLSLGLVGWANVKSRKDRAGSNA